MHNNVGRWNKNEVSMDKMPRCPVIYKSIKHKNSNRYERSAAVLFRFILIKIEKKMGQCHGKINLRMTNGVMLKAYDKNVIRNL